MRSLATSGRRCEAWRVGARAWPAWVDLAAAGPKSAKEPPAARGAMHPKLARAAYESSWVQDVSRHFHVGCKDFRKLLNRDHARPAQTRRPGSRYRMAGASACGPGRWGLRLRSVSCMGYGLWSSDCTAGLLASLCLWCLVRVPARGTAHHQSHLGYCRTRAQMCACVSLPSCGCATLCPVFSTSGLRLHDPLYLTTGATAAAAAAHLPGTRLCIWQWGHATIAVFGGTPKCFRQP